jgi:hypothetical protein
LLQRQRRQLLDHGIDVIGRRQPAADIEEPPDVARIPPGLNRGFVDDGVGFDEIGRFDIALRGQPAIGLAPDQLKHARLVGAQPDPDLMMGQGSASGTPRLVIGPVDPDATGSPGVPDAADDADALIQRVDALSGAELVLAHGLYAIPECAGAEPEFNAPL